MDKFDMEVVDSTSEINSKENHIAFLQKRIDARGKQIDVLMDRVQAMQKANSRDLLRMHEVRLLKDIRDGRVNLVHAETGKPITVHVFKNPQ